MDVLDPIKEFAEWLLNAVFRFTLEKIKKIPLIIAQSTELMRLVTLAGIAALSLGLLAINIHIVRVNDIVKETEDIAKKIDLDIQSRLLGAVKVAEATEWLIRNKRLSDDPERYVEIIQTLPWIKSSEISGVTLVSDKGFSILYGKLDPSYNSPNWENIRWNEIRNKIASELKGADESINIFLGIERLFRGAQEFHRGQQLVGSLVIARAWKEDSGWGGVVIMLPVQSFNSLLRLGPEQYSSGNYDYLVDSEGFLLAHPTPFFIYGTDPNGRSLKGAANRDEVGRFPINTRDSDWIAGTDTLNEAFNSMLNHQPITVVYKNLQNQDRLTSFRLVELDNIKGKSFGIVAGRGLTALEALTIPVLLKSSSPLKTILWVTAGIYLTLISLWLAFISKFTSLRIDLLDLAGYMSASTANAFGLLPIPKGKPKINEKPDGIFSADQMVAVVLSLELAGLNMPIRNNMIEAFGKLCSKLRDDGWITRISSPQLVIACRPLIEQIEGRRAHRWSPINVVQYFREIDDFQPIRIPNENISCPRYRIVYGIGNFRIEVRRADSTKRATISWSDSSKTCISETYHYFEEVKNHDGALLGVLIYPVKEALDAGIQPNGDKEMINSREYRKLSLA